MLSIAFFDNQSEQVNIGVLKVNASTQTSL